MKSSLSRKEQLKFIALQIFLGLTFIKIIGLILSSAIHKVMDTNNFYKKFTMDELLADLYKI
jgi:hypothetical protein